MNEIIYVNSAMFQIGRNPLRGISHVEKHLRSRIRGYFRKRPMGYHQEEIYVNAQGFLLL